MIDFVAPRVFRALITISLVVVVVFVATRLSGNAVDFLLPPGADSALRAEMASTLGIDQPISVQFGKFIKNLTMGEFGTSFYERRPVSDIFSERLPNTLILFSGAFILSIALGVPLGVFSALNRLSGLRYLVVIAALIGYATPSFVIAILMILQFSLRLHWLPSSGNETLLHFVMPALVIATSMIAEIVRHTRNAMLDVMTQDYIRTAVARGLPALSVICVHALRNAAVILITIIGIQIATLVGRCVVVEAVFATRGLGDLLVSAAINRDYPVLQFGVIVIAVFVIASSIVTDAIYAIIDPRIRAA